MGRRKAWSFDPLEGRDLLSITPMLGLLGTRVASTAAYAIGNANPVTSFEGGSGITTDTSPPTAAEVARRAFKGVFNGRVVELAPRLQDQSRQFAILAPGGTNQFLHGTLQMSYFTPSATANADTFSGGAMSMSDRSTNSAGVILANLDAPTQVDGRGRPTRYNFTVNGGGGSGGIYSSSVGNGTVTITYHGKQARVVVVGSIFIQGIGQPLAVSPSSVGLS